MSTTPQGLLNVGGTSGVLNLTPTLPNGSFVGSAPTATATLTALPGDAGDYQVVFIYVDAHFCINQIAAPLTILPVGVTTTTSTSTSTSTTLCVPGGAPCNLNNPGACCSLACLSNSGGLDGTCFPVSTTTTSTTLPDALPLTPRPPRP